MVVNPEHTALMIGSGDLQVLSTPVLAAIMENAAMMAIIPLLKEGETSVGSFISLNHNRPTAVGKSVAATARLIRQQGRKFFFEIEAVDNDGEIATAQHTRVAVDIKRFMEKLENK